MYYECMMLKRKWCIAECPANYRLQEPDTGERQGAVLQGGQVSCHCVIALVV
jgi:hypothetical protein